MAMHRGTACTFFGIFHCRNILSNEQKKKKKKSFFRHTQLAFFQLEYIKFKPGDTHLYDGLDF